jgi:hypothetical protein
LLQNTGYLPPNFWVNLWRLWPLILVLVGIELLLAHRIPWLVLVAVGAVVLCLGAVSTMSSVPHQYGPAAVTRSLQTDLGGARQAAVMVRFGAGQLIIGPLLQPGPDQLAMMTYEGPVEMTPQPRYATSNGGIGQLEYEVSGRGPGFLPFASGRSDALRMQVDLNPAVPITTLTVQSGAADAKLDLSTLRVSTLDINVGAAATTVQLPEAAGATSAHISGGAATITVNVPQGVAARIQHRGGLSTLTVDSSRFTLVSDGLYQSPDYAAAQNKVDLTLETGIATIQIS